MTSLIQSTRRKGLAALLCAALLPLLAWAPATAQESDAEKALLYRLIGEMIVDIDTMSSHAKGRDAFGSGPVSTKFEQFYEAHVAAMPEWHRVQYFMAGMRHLRFQGGTMHLFLDVVGNDSAVGAFKDRLRLYIDTAERINRVTWGAKLARKVLSDLERRARE